MISKQQRVKYYKQGEGYEYFIKVEIDAIDIKMIRREVYDEMVEKYEQTKQKYDREALEKAYQILNGQTDNQVLKDSH